MGKQLLTKDGLQATEQVLNGKSAVGIYFSAHWCPPCRGFTPELAKMYTDTLKDLGLEIVFVSSDRDEKAFSDYFSEQPWLALPFEARDLKGKLSKKFKVSGIPSLVILDPEGQIITIDGRSAVMEDPEGKNFPWKPKPLIDIIHSATVATKDDQKIKLTDVLSGRQVGLYFSAH